jgi:hypothetical protein
MRGAGEAGAAENRREANTSKRARAAGNTRPAPGSGTLVHSETGTLEQQLKLGGGDLGGGRLRGERGEVAQATALEAPADNIQPHAVMPEKMVRGPFANTQLSLLCLVPSELRRSHRSPQALLHTASACSEV